MRPRHTGRVAASCSALLWLAVAIAADYPGFVLAPPPGEGWVQVQRDAHSLVWMGRGDDTRITFSAALFTGAADPRARAGFVDWVGAVKRANPEPGRYTLSLPMLEPAPEAGPDCARYVSRLEERAAPGRVLVIHGLACLHPRAPDRYFDLQYSFRHPAGIGPDAADLAAGEAFIAGFGFRPPPADGDWTLAPGISRPGDRERT